MEIFDITFYHAKKIRLIFITKILVCSDFLGDLKRMAVKQVPELLSQRQLVVKNPLNYRRTEPSCDNKSEHQEMRSDKQIITELYHASGFELRQKEESIVRKNTCSLAHRLNCQPRITTPCGPVLYFSQNGVCPGNVSSQARQRADCAKIFV